METLRVKNMQNRHLAKAIGDAAWYSLRTKTAYKAERAGKHFVLTDQWAATTKTCHCCGFKTTTHMALSVRDWTCDNCGVVHDRDINAACVVKDLTIVALRAGGWHVPVCGGLRKTGETPAAAVEAESKAA